MKIQNEKKKLYIFISLCLLSIIMLISTIILTNKSNEFIPPEFERNAMEGVPPVDLSDYDYTGPEGDNLAYYVKLCAKIVTEGNKLVSYFTNVEGNDDWLKVRVYDQSKILLGETGILKPNQYCKYIQLNRKIDKTEPITLVIMGYEPETYYSTGNITLTIKP